MGGQKRKCNSLDHDILGFVKWLADGVANIFWWWQWSYKMGFEVLSNEFTIVQLQHKVWIRYEVLELNVENFILSKSQCYHIEGLNHISILDFVQTTQRR